MKFCGFFCSLLLWSANATAAGQLPADKFDVMWKKSPVAFQFAKKCLPSVSENTFKLNSLAADDGQTQTIGDSSTKGANYVLLSNDAVFCIPSSLQGFPILALQAFNETVAFEGLTQEQKRQVYDSLSQQISMTGAGEFLVQFDNDNAVNFTAKVQETRAQRLYYDSVFMKAGSYDLSKHPNVIRAPIKSFVKTTHGGGVGKSLALGILVDRPLLDAKYLVVVGSNETTAFNFAGTNWKFGQSLTTISLSANGQLVFKPTAGKETTGEWKVVGGVLYMSYGSIHFSGVLDGDSRLKLEGRTVEVNQAQASVSRPDPQERRWLATLNKAQ
jgi:hypothetical protein